MFDFRLLSSLPKPKGVLVVCALVFFGLTNCYWFFTETTADDLSGSLHEFLLKEHSTQPKHPQILVAGASISGYGFHIGELEKRTGKPVAKISLDGSHLKDVLDILECYPDECQYAKVLLLGTSPAGLTYDAAYYEKEHTNEDFWLRMNKIRRKFFNKMRGTTATFELTDYLGRSSIWNFLRLCFKRTEKRYQTSEGYFEKDWDDPRFDAAKEKERILLRKRAEEVRQNREKQTSESPAPQEKKGKQYDKRLTSTVHQLLDLCSKRGIFVVVCIMPEWYGRVDYTQNDLDRTTDDPNVNLMQELNQRSNCAVIICKDFETITNEGTDEDYLFDYGHMRRKGAMVYSNWLVDRLLENSKTAELIKSEREQPD